MALSLTRAHSHTLSHTLTHCHSHSHSLSHTLTQSHTLAGTGAEVPERRALVGPGGAPEHGRLVPPPHPSPPSPPTAPTGHPSAWTLSGLPLPQDVCLTLSHSHTLTLSHSHTLALSHSHTLALSHSHTLTRQVVRGAAREHGAAGDQPEDASLLLRPQPRRVPCHRSRPTPRTPNPEPRNPKPETRNPSPKP